MKPAFQQIFWGFLLVFFEIHLIYVDILADPIGYYLIFKGLKNLKEQFMDSKKAITASLVLIFFSIPSVFISNNRLKEIQMTEVDFYQFALSIGNLLLIFFIFKLMIEIVVKFENEQLLKRIQIIFLLYMISSFSTLIIQPFLGLDALVLLVGISFATGIAAFIMHIIFLIQLWKFRNLQEYKPKPSSPITMTTFILLFVAITSGVSYYLTLLATRPTAAEFNEFIEERYGVYCMGEDCSALEIPINNGEKIILMVSSGSSGQSDTRLYRRNYYFSEDPELNYRFRFYIEGRLGKFEVLDEHSNIEHLLKTKEPTVSGEGI